MVAFTDLGGLSLDLTTRFTSFDSRDAIGALQLMTASVSCLSPESDLNEFHARNVWGGANKVKTGKAQSYGHLANSGNIM
jgi:hypothetical protein